MRDLQSKNQILTNESTKRDVFTKELAAKLEQEKLRNATEKDRLLALMRELDAVNVKCVAQDNVIRGLREERALWSQELVTQVWTIMPFGRRHDCIPVCYHVCT